MQLRPYQAQAIQKVKWALTIEGNGIVSLPTGAGKSIVIAQLANDLDCDVLILQPSKEILDQNRKKLLNYVDISDVGVYSASFGEKDIKKYTFATIGSVYKIPEHFGHFGVVLIDECHSLNNKKDQSMFTSFLEDVNGLRADAGLPPTRVIGFTATPYRVYPTYFKGNDGALYQANSIKVVTRTKPQFFDKIIYNVNNHELVEQGFLCPLKYIDHTLIEQELIPVNKSGTDFDLDAYENTIKTREQRIIDGLTVALETHKSVLVFCTSISQAERLAGHFWASESVSSKTPAEERDRIITDFKNGDVKMVFNVGVLTTGFDFPELDCIVLLRPTRSIALYYQMLGRGVRLAEGKTHCTVIDFTNTVERLGRIETIKLEKVEGKWDVTTETGNWHGVEMYRFKVKDAKPRDLFS